MLIVWLNILLQLPGYFKPIRNEIRLLVTYSYVFYPTAIKRLKFVFSWLKFYL